MVTSPMTSATPAPRLADLGDVNELVRLRGLMFSAMGIEPDDQSWRYDAAEHYERMLSNGRIIGAVVDNRSGDGLVSGAVASFIDRIPGPNHPGVVAHISSMCTEPDHRRCGLGAAVLDLLLAQVRKRGVTIVELHATPDGEALYRSRGFVERPGGHEMRAVLGA